MGIAIPWAILMGIQAYKHGFAVKDQKGNPTPKMPEPYWFFWGSASMGIAGAVAIFHARLGVVLAWGLLFGAMMYNYQASKTVPQLKQAQANPSGQALASRTVTKA
jgi:hypothetical protein